METPHSALKYEFEVPESGQLDIKVPFPAGTRVVVLVQEESADDFKDIVNASQTSLDFWDNPYDDEDWNNA